MFRIRWEMAMEPMSATDSAPSAEGRKTFAKLLFCFRGEQHVAASGSQALLPNEIPGVIQEVLAMTRLQVSASAISMAALLTSYSALAQQASGTASVGVQGQTNAAAAAPAAAPATATTDVNATQTTQAPAPVAAANANAPAGNSEHDDMVGHLAVGYLGRATIPYGQYNGAATLQAPVPVIGVRYWLDPMIGLDLGAGLWMGSTSTDVTAPGANTSTSVSGPKPTAFILHAGVPLALTSSKHFAFEIIPELNLGHASVTQDAALTPNVGITKQSGTHFDLGARAGAEIHFGFIGIPQLSLVGSVGLRFNYDKLTYEAEPVAGAGRGKISTGMWDLSTTVNESPWNIFISNVSAFYYF
jgi:hypothetical protein